MMTHARPFTSNDGASYQINGKIEKSKGGEIEYLRPFWVGRFALSYSLAHNKNILYTNTSIRNIFKRQNFVRVLIETRTITKEALFKITFKNTFHKHIFELFSKQTLCMRSYRNDNHYKVIFSKYFQKPTPQSTFKQKQVI